MSPAAPSAPASPRVPEAPRAPQAAGRDASVAPRPLGRDGSLRPAVAVGKRQRMYLFERVYVDYAVHLRRFAGGVGAACLGIWRWFWQGPGALAIELMLRVLVAVSAIGAAAWVLRYESEHGRGLSIGTILGVGAVFVFVAVLMWSWKAPLHFLARAVSGAIATAAVMVLGGLALATAALVFSAYLLVLFVLTALSFVVFVPMRCAHTLWLVYWRITYSCPHDDCPKQKSRNLPIHVCECGARYSDLQPSFYGIFHHRCRAGDHDVTLPTMNFLGRNRLPRLCRGCERPLIHSSIGELPVKPIAIVGGVGTGKTVFLVQAMRQLRERVLALPGGNAQIDSRSQEREYDAQTSQLDRGLVLPKTSGDVMPAFGLALRVPGKTRCLVYLYDAPGEVFTSMERFGRKQSIDYLSGLILLVDPFALPGLVEDGRQLGARVQASAESLNKIASALVGRLKMTHPQGPDGKWTLPLAVVLSKVDALRLTGRDFLTSLDPREPEGGDAASLAWRDVIHKLGEAHTVRLLEQNFSTVRYFACTALGRAPDGKDRSGFRAAGVAAPLLWLLGFEPAGGAGRAAGSTRPPGRESRPAGLAPR